MAGVVLEIEAVFCGPVSVGTVSVIKLVREHLGLGLGDAKEYVDRAVFGGERVTIPAPDVRAAERLVAALAELPGSPRVRASVCV
jgi:ribosomal protein L7/L12